MNKPRNKRNLNVSLLSVIGIIVALTALLPNGSPLVIKFAQDSARAGIMLKEIMLPIMFIEVFSVNKKLKLNLSEKILSEEPTIYTMVAIVLLILVNII